MNKFFIVLVGLLIWLSTSFDASGQELLPYTKVDNTAWTNDDFGTAEKTFWNITGNGLVIGFHGGGGKSGNRNSENWAFSPAIQLKEVSNFLQYSDIRVGGSGSSFSIMIAQDDNGTVPPRSSFVTVDQWTAPQATETNQRIDLSSWSGQTVRLAFLRTNELGAGWTVNNIQVLGSNIFDVEEFKVSSITDSSIQVTWLEPQIGLEYLLVGADGEIDFIPTNGISYTANDLAGGNNGKVLMSSSNLSFGDNGLEEFDSRFYKVWSYDPNTLEYSLAGRTANGTTTGASTIFYEDFEGTEDPGNIDQSTNPDHRTWTSGNGYTWRIESSDFSDQDEWLINGNETSYRGTQSAHIVQDGNTLPAYAGTTVSVSEESILVDISASDLDVSKYKSVELSFFWKAGGKTGYDYGDVFINGDRMTDGGLTGQTSWKESVIDITGYLEMDITLEFYWYNDPAYSGVHDPSFCVDEVMITGKSVARPKSFSATAINSSQVDLAWQKNTENQDVIIAYTSSETLGSPDESTPYNVGDMLPGGGEVIYKGADTSFSHMLESGGQANYKIWSVSSADTYSTALSASTVMPASLPFFDGFEDEFNWNVIASVNNSWYRGQAEAKNGSYSAYVSKNGGFTTDYDGADSDVRAILELPVNLSGFSEVIVDFDWKLDGNINSTWGYVQLENGGNTYALNNPAKLADQSTWQSVTDWTISNDIYFDAVSLLRFYMKIDGGDTNLGFVVDNVNIEGILKPVTNVIADNSGGLKNYLSWTNAASNLEVVIAEGINGEAIGELTSGENYYVGDLLPSGGKIVYIGTGESFVQDPVMGGQTYGYKVFQKNGETYSSGVLSNAVTTPDNVGFFEDFENGNEKNWTLGSNGGGTWKIGFPANGYDNGTNVAFVSSDGQNANYIVNKHDPFIVTMSLTASVEKFESGTTYAFDYYWNNGGYANATASYTIVAEGVNESGTLAAGTGWNSLEVPLSPTGTASTIDYTISFALDIPNNNSNGIKTPGFLVDNISITGSYDNTSIVSNGAGGQDVSSLKDNSNSVVEVFTFDIQDMGSGDTKPTDIHQVTFTKGADNTLVDWREVIRGAALYDNSDVLIEYGAVQTDGILFDKENLLSVADGTTESYKLKIWLNESLDTSVDNGVLDFTLSSEDIVAYNGSNFSGSITTGESGTSNVRIVATELEWMVHPSVSAVTGTKLTTQPKVMAVDANGNIDSDYSSDVVLVSNPSEVIGTLTVAAVDGIATYSDLLFGTAGTFVLEASSGALMSVSSQDISVSDGGGSTAGGTQYIGAVKLGGIENYTYERSTAGYGLFIDQEARMTKGVDYELSVYVSGEANLKVYVDYDGNNIFDETSELLHDFGLKQDEVAQAWVRISPEKSSGSYRLRVEFVNGSNEGEIEDYTVIATDNQWTGYTPEWDVNANWSSGAVPVDNVYIPGNPVDGNFFPVLDLDRFVDKLTIEAGAQITLKPGISLSVNSSLKNDGIIVLRSTVDEVSVLNVPESNTNSGQGRIELPVKANQWYRLGQPIVSPTGAIYDAAELTSWIYKSKRSYERIVDDVTSIDPMEGIMVLYEADHIIDYSGELNTGSMNWTIPYGTGYYLFSNPYPSSINWNIKDGLDTGVSISDNLSETIYYRVYAGSQVGDYMVTYNGFTDVSNLQEGDTFPGGYTAQNIGNISPMQSVWVRVSNSQDATIDLTNKARIADNSMPLKSGTADSGNGRDLLRIVRTNDVISDVAIVYFDEAFSDGADRADSEKMFNSSEEVPEIYTRSGNIPLVINGLSSLSDEDFSMPLSVRNRSMVATTIRVDMEEFTESYDVFLEDRETGVLTDMREVGNYTYNPLDQKDVHDRFVLHLKKVQEVPTDLNDLDVTEVGGIEITGHDDFALVEVSPELVYSSSALIEVMDMNGRRLSTLNSSETETMVILPGNSGAYIIRVNAGGQVKSEKVVRGK